MEEKKPKILVVDDEEIIRKTFVRILKTEGYDFLEASTIKQAEELIVKEHPDVTLLDVRLPDGSGLELLEKVKTSGIDSEVVIITAYGSVEMAVEAVKKGAFDFRTKPIDPMEKLF